MGECEQGYGGGEKDSQNHSIVIVFFKEKCHFDINSNGKECRIGTKAWL